MRHSMRYAAIASLINCTLTFMQYSGYTLTYTHTLLVFLFVPFTSCLFSPHTWVFSVVCRVIHQRLSAFLIMTLQNIHHGRESQWRSDVRAETGDGNQGETGECELLCIPIWLQLAKRTSKMITVFSSQDECVFICIFLYLEGDQKSPLWSLLIT